jgi:tRNA (cytosine38-C5)-methyltransferase
VEFFAGMGGMRAAGHASGVDVEVVAAYEISEVCAKAYVHNFGKEHWRLKTIESLSVEELDSLACDAWLMSPPCQPFTRSGKRLDNEDNRTLALQHLVRVLPQMRNPPKRLLLENVIGFEQSECRRRLLATLADMGWEAAEFSLDPEDFGLPNRRPRYYGLFRAPVPSSVAVEERGLSSTQARSVADAKDLESMHASCWRSAQEVLAGGSQHGEVVLQGPPPNCRYSLQCLGDLLQSPQDIAAEEAHLQTSLEVPQQVMEDRVSKEGRYDIHLRGDHSSACFTKWNGRLPRGHSPLVLVDEAEAGPLEQRPKVSAQGEGPGMATDHVWRPGVRVRYLSPTEQLRLMGYPDTYSFPEALIFRDISSMIGNSLNVRVVSWLIFLLLSSHEVQHDDGHFETLGEEDVKDHRT